MADTRGFVQRIKVINTGAAIAFIGPDRANVEVFGLVPRIDSPPEVIASYTAMTDALSAAMFARREVFVSHTRSQIYRVEIEGP
jgi:hypothetical protein